MSAKVAFAISLLWIALATTSFLFAASQVRGGGGVLQVPLEFFTGILTLDAVLLAVLGLRPDTSLVAGLSKQYRNINLDLLAFFLILSAAFAAYKLLHVAPGTQFTGISLKPGFGRSGFLSLVFTTLALSFWIVTSLLVLLGRFSSRVILFLWRNPPSHWLGRLRIPAAPGPFPYLGFGIGAIASVIVGSEMLLVIGMGPKGPDDWWYFVTVLIGYLLSSGSVWVFGKWQARHRSQLWIPFEFVLFFFLILFVTIFREYSTVWAANAFDHQGSLAWFALFFFGIGIPFLVYLDFIRRMWWRRPNQGPQ